MFQYGGRQYNSVPRRALDISEGVFNELEVVFRGLVGMTGETRRRNRDLGSGRIGKILQVAEQGLRGYYVSRGERGGGVGKLKRKRSVFLDRGRARICVGKTSAFEGFGDEDRLRRVYSTEAMMRDSPTEVGIRDTQIFDDVFLTEHGCKGL